MVYRRGLFVYMFSTLICVRRHDIKIIVILVFGDDL